jgi:hypothetical protein
MHRLENLDSNFTLLKDAYEESKKLFEIKIPSWYGSITLLIKNIRGLKELSNVSKHKFKFITGHVEHDIRKCFSSSVSPDVQRRQSLSCRRAT